MSLPSEQWPRVKELFDAAVELLPDERAALLDRACDGDETLRKEVESLLASDNQAHSFIEAPRFAMPAGLLSEEAEDFADRRFGAYRTIREIGRGGLGTVYLAARADDQYQKQVAIKLVRRGLDTDDILSRFRAERQILAQLDHSNIARLIDAGSTEEGLPYFVMEFIDGQPISTYCDSQQLSVAGRLKLFRAVCSAVTYAHQHLVVHRDIKPSNILVPKEGVPKLLDFGIAKVLHAEDPLAAQTMTGIRIMTPEYASPEQVRGLPITTSSDIYSLGVLLYELLTGQKPYRLTSRAPEEIARAITDQIPERPSTAVGNSERRYNTTAPTLRGDLDNIVLMALRKEPQRRYASVEQFAEDIRRHLEGRPVIAHKDTVSYRSGKFMRRHKVGMLATALIIGALLAGLVTTLREKRRAERRFNDVRQLSNALLTEIVPKIERLEGSTEARQALVEQSLKYLDSLAGESGSDLELQAELAAAYEKVGVLQGDPRKPSLSDFRGAIASLEKANLIRRQLLEANPSDLENQRLLAENLRLLSLRRIYSRDDMERGFRNGDEAVSIYENLVAKNPASLALKRASLETQTENAIGYADTGRFAEAIPRFEQAAGRIAELHRTHPDDAETARILANFHGYLGFSLSWGSRQPEAEAEMTRAIQTMESLVARRPNEPNLRQELWRIYQMAAGIYEEVDNARGFELCEKARRIAEENIALDRSNAQARHNLAKTFSRLAVFAVHLGKADDALAYLQQGAAILSDLQSKDPLSRAYLSDFAMLHARIGQAKYKKGDLAGALAPYEESRAAYERLIANKDTNALQNLAVLLKSIGSVHRDYFQTATGQVRQTHLDAAKENYRQAVERLLQAEAKNALSEFDRQNLEQTRATLAELEQLR